jgi:hypothetical protein
VVRGAHAGGVIPQRFDGITHGFEFAQLEALWIVKEHGGPENVVGQPMVRHPLPQANERIRQEQAGLVALENRQLKVCGEAAQSPATGMPNACSRVASMISRSKAA